MTTEEKIKLVDHHAALLAEHYDCVQILCSTHLGRDEGTESVYSGLGNWFARQGMARDFQVKAEAETHASHIGAKINPPDDGADGWKNV
jgi:hypothetical protein